MNKKKMQKAPPEMIEAWNKQVVLLHEIRKEVCDCGSDSMWAQEHTPNCEYRKVTDFVGWIYDE